MSKMRYFF